jgi:hypothetical protein
MYRNQLEQQKQILLSNFERMTEADRAMVISLCAMRAAKAPKQASHLRLVSSDPSGGVALLSAAS